MAGAATSAIILIIFILVVVLAIIFPKGKRGEMNVAAILKTLPSDKYLVLNNLLLKSGNWTSQIDHVVISIYGIFVIETKNYKGWISGGENSGYWTQNIYGHKYQLRNPIHQNQTHIKAIRRCLGDDGRIMMIPVIAFSNRATLRLKTETAIVTYFFRLRKAITSYSSPVLSSDEVQIIFNTLSEANITDRSERKEHVSSARASAKRASQKVANGICPRCGGALVERSGRYGRFYGCSNYPTCKYTINE